MDFEYDNWNTVKKRIADSDHKAPYFKEGDIWWVSIGYNIGYETYGKGKDFARPVLIIRKFNKYLFIGVPLSSIIKENPFYIPIKYNNKTDSALISQVRSFSSQRLLFKHAEIDTEDLCRVKNRFITLFK